ncbi:MAG: DUF2007 domain-containing protein [Fibrobacterota bacterium]|nr:DUF2007 domain-containing protein [Fibrobacterota bacterium]
MSLVAIYSSPSRIDSTLIRNMLQNAGIEAALRTDDANGNLPSLDLAEGVDVWVDESEVGEATALLQEYQKGALAIDEDQGE